MINLFKKKIQNILIGLIEKNLKKLFLWGHEIQDTP